MVVIVLELENIGGLAGRHRFELREGLSEIVAPNAMGKTSLVKALLAMYVPRMNPGELLNYDADEGYVKVEMEGKVFIKRFKREGGRVVEVESNPIAMDDKVRFMVLDPQFGEIVKRLVLEARSDITDYLTKVFRLDEYSKRKEDLRSQIEDLEKTIEYLKKDVKELAEADEKRKELQSKHAELKQELEKVKAVSVEKVKQIEERIMKLNKKLGVIETRIRDLENELIPTAGERVRELQAEVERLKRILNEFYEHYREPNKHVENIKERIKKADDLRATYEKEASELIAGEDARIPVVKMAMLIKATKCPTCGRHVERPEEFWPSKLKEVEDEVRKRKEAIVKEYEKRIRRVDEERVSLWKELEEFTKKYNEVREIENIRLPKYTAQLESLTKSLEGYKEELVRLKNERDAIVKELEELKRGLSEEEKKAAEQRESMEKRLGELEQRIKDVEELIAKKSESGKRLYEVSKRLEELRKDLEVTERELYDTLAEMKDEFAKIASEVIRELGFSWLKSIRLVTDETKKSFEVKVIRVLPSGREVEQPLNTLSTSERLALSLIVVLTGYKLKILDEHKGMVPIIADEALLAFDPQRLEKVVEELKRYAKYVVITRLARPDEVSRLTIVHKR
jgi:DNA repair exonuclease SbcCD ATPase subunit